RPHTKVDEVRNMLMEWRTKILPRELRITPTDMDAIRRQSRFSKFYHAIAYMFEICLHHTFQLHESHRELGIHGIWSNYCYDAAIGIKNIYSTRPMSRMNSHVILPVAAGAFANIVASKVLGKEESAQKYCDEIKVMLQDIVRASTSVERNQLVNFVSHGYDGVTRNSEAKVDPFTIDTPSTPPWNEQSTAYTESSPSYIENTDSENEEDHEEGDNETLQTSDHEGDGFDRRMTDNIAGANPDFNQHPYQNHHARLHPIMSSHGSDSNVYSMNQQGQQQQQVSYQHQRKFSVLVLGKIQSGKSTLIQYFKNYANPSLAIDHSLLGNNTFSKTERSHPFRIKSSLPSYEVFDRRSGETMDLRNHNTKQKDDDYHDLLFSRKADMDLRTVPDPNKQILDDIMEFEFLDTPGLCNHENKDVAHAANVVESIISARAFSLILIVVNPHDPLTAELLLALQYYSEVLHGLNSNIAFVFTHVDYAHSRFTNADLHLSLKEKSCTLSRIFSGSAAYNSELYPSFALDLDHVTRPVFQCLIRNTLKDILQLVVSKPLMLMDTRSKNIERIKHIIHPSNFDFKQRKEALARIYGECRLPAKYPIRPGSESRGALFQDVNIVLMGDAQSGKTALIEAMKLYVNPISMSNADRITHDRIGDADEFFHGYTFFTSLHTYEVRKLAEKDGDYITFSLENGARELSSSDFLTMMEMNQGSVCTRIKPFRLIRNYRFNIFELPGLQENTGSVQGQIAKICRVFADSNKTIHQILVTLAPDSITSPTRQIIASLISTFPNVNTLLSFVHTKIDYHDHHSSNKQVHDSMREKKEQLQGLLQSSPPIFMINSDPNLDRPVQYAITLNTVHDIFLAAIKSKPRFSVLVLGQTQSGKSSLVQHIKKYADPAYTIDYNLLGDGNNSKTESTEHCFINSNLPAYEILDLEADSTLNLDTLHARYEDKDDYFDLLHSRESKFTLRISPNNSSMPRPELVEFKFLDTPGFNDTGEGDVVLSTHIISEIIEARSFNLILVVVPHTSPLTQEQGFALEYYAKVLEGLHSNIAFLYTRVKYADLHHSDTVHQSQLKTRHRAFSKIFRQQRFVPTNSTDASAGSDDTQLHSHFTVDLDHEKRPIIQCLIRNTIKDILQMAMANTPVTLDTSTGRLEKIWAIHHPEAANQLHRERCRAANQAEMALRPQTGGPEEDENVQQGAVIMGSAAQCNISAMVFSDTDGEDYFSGREE
ncbi:hypothetical protein BGZ82_009739, partial [Podila clonocystis]